jgi:multidrug resistance efflux pump
MMCEEEEPSARMTTPAPAPKKQKKIAKDVTEVRRSTRIAKLCDDFKDKAAADQAKANMNQAETGSDIGEINKKKKKAQVTKKSNKTTFSASVIDTSAPPPPELSIDNVHTIGVG